MIKIDIKKRLNGAYGIINFELSHTFEKNEFWTIFGESGIGKTTLLRMIAGLEIPDSGTIEVDGVVWFDSKYKINLTPQKRRVGFVFQSYALFEHMSVLENLLFAQPTPDKIKATKVLEIMGLRDLASRNPQTLSGGQQQRVALARAIVQEPKVLLLDEPLSSLDTITRLRLQDELKRTHEQFGLLTLMVSHDQSEAIKLSDQILWIKDGIKFKTGSPKALFLPKTLSGGFSFLGKIISIEHRDTSSMIIVEIGQNLIEKKVTQEEASTYSVGQEITIVAKTFDLI
ncbi:ABC transporter ATP-binding protein [Sulfurimonas sp.]|uniref:ABC transporter ATP-binding protein n=1 Tax=Sulfurimonas sp. TaxID=2022749 RepID=UPI0025CDD2AC|nr:ABC transporter ATP-binding protein [Sulfurimonas sp.]